MFDDLLLLDPLADESALVDRLSALERLKAVAAAAQARVTAALDQKRRAAEAARGVPAATRGRGLTSEIALARHDAPVLGSRHLGFARALVHEMPHTLAALEAGVLSEWRATLIVRESACLTIEDRRTLDAELCADQQNLTGMGNKRIAAEAKSIAYRLDPRAVVDRAVRAESERNVTCRPAPDSMTYVTALLPMAQGVSVYATLKREADTCGDGRSRGQVMADTFVERITGHSRCRSRSTWSSPTRRCWRATTPPLASPGTAPCLRASRAGLPRERSPTSGPGPRCVGSTSTPSAAR